MDGAAGEGKRGAFASACGGRFSGAPGAWYRRGVMAKPRTLAFLRTEAGAGALLAVSALLALIAANSRFAAGYEAFVNWPLPLRLGGFARTASVAGWVRDGLMTAVFLVIGLQVKFEIVKGEVSSPRRFVLPLVSAAGGLLAPALLIAILSPHAPWPDWLAAGASDTALALAALSAVGRPLPDSVRLFLLVVAGADILAVSALGALAGPGRIDADGLFMALALLLGLGLMGRWRAAPRLFYAVGFVLVWGLLQRAGIGAALAGFGCAAVTPVRVRRGGVESVGETFVNGLHGYVAFLILPLFVFVAAGAPLREVGWRGLLGGPAAALLLAMVAAKPAGVLGGAFLAAVLRVGRKPLEASWSELAGAALLCGAGLTFSLYVAGAAGTPAPAVRAAILAASALAVAAGVGVLASAAQSRRAVAAEAARLNPYRASRRA
ncbi:MAG TPA: Na+/H+ antiporter NhaA [Caulobacteraceae bacterium]|jgi:NhaA family Na+:H+ antiporter|nr:Na+/H+ antiporter NhaA [Caulobacteraceae bacterium]